jgi:hypothetical protein
MSNPAYLPHNKSYLDFPNESYFGEVLDYHKKEYRRIPSKISYSIVGGDSKTDYKIKKFLLPDRVKTVILGNLTFELPEDLNEIIELIEYSKHLLKYEDDWDDEGAEATDIVTLSSAVSFLTSYAKHLNEKDVTIPTPDIDIMRDGSISLHWDTQNGKLLIIFKKNNPSNFYFYGESKKTGIPFKYAVQNVKEIDEIISIWIQKNL